MNTLTEQLLQELATELGIAPLAVNEDGHCALVVDNDMLLDIELKPEQERLILTALVGTLHSSSRSEQLSGLMQLNMALYKELGMCLSLEGQTNSIVLTHSVDAGLSSVFDLENALSLFLKQTEKCRHLLEHRRQNPAPANILPGQAICV